MGRLIFKFLVILGLVSLMPAAQANHGPDFDFLSNVEGELVLELNPSNFTDKERKIYGPLLNPAKGDQIQRVVLFIEGKSGFSSLLASDINVEDSDENPIKFTMPILQDIIHKRAENKSKVFYSNQSIIHLVKNVTSVEETAEHTEKPEMKSLAYQAHGGKILYQRLGDKGVVKGSFGSKAARGRFFITLSKANKTSA
jgi:hypothetical protein